MPNTINHKKLIGSKWSRFPSLEQQRHFEIKRWLKPHEGDKGMLEIEAVLTGQLYWMHYKALKDDSLWRMGWH